MTTKYNVCKYTVNIDIYIVYLVIYIDIIRIT